MTQFEKLGFDKPLMRAIHDQGFSEPTEIQDKAVPLVLKGLDVIGSSSTGSGKTLTFSCGMIQNGVKGDGVQGLVICPTRELAEQVAKNINIFSQYTTLRVAVVYGGVPIQRQIKNLRSADIVVGTPGRLLDHLKRKTINLSKVNTLVLDEADRMLDMGFVDDVEAIIHECPMNRQTLFFTATMSSDVSKLAKRHLRKPTLVEAESHVNPDLLTQVCYEVVEKKKFSLLVHLLKEDESERVIVFCNTKRRCNTIKKNLATHGIDAAELHGGLEQRKRTRVLDRFHKDKFKVLVCTDVAARGIHIEGVSHVYNFSVPTEPKQYMHRVGRTARAGAEGLAVIFLSKKDTFPFKRMVKINGVHIDRKITPQFEKLDLKVEKDKNGRKRNPGGDERFRKLRENVWGRADKTPSSRRFSRDRDDRSERRGSRFSRDDERPRRSFRDRDEGSSRGGRGSDRPGRREREGRGSFKRNGTRGRSRDDRSERRERFSRDDDKPRRSFRDRNDDRSERRGRRSDREDRDDRRSRSTGRKDDHRPNRNGRMSRSSRSGDSRGKRSRSDRGSRGDRDSRDSRSEGRTRKPRTPGGRNFRGGRDRESNRDEAPKKKRGPKRPNRGESRGSKKRFTKKSGRRVTAVRNRR